MEKKKTISGGNVPQSETAPADQQQKPGASALWAVVHTPSHFCLLD